MEYKQWCGSDYSSGTGLCNNWFFQNTPSSENINSVITTLPGQK